LKRDLMASLLSRGKKRGQP